MPPPAMSHSPAYYEQYRTSHNSSPAVRQMYPPQRPHAAHVVGKSQPFSQADHLKTSISSATSRSTDSSDPRNTTTQTHSDSADIERGHGRDVRNYQSRRSPTDSQRQTHATYGHREMAQAPPDTVVRYIRQDVDEDEVPENPDHAIWILVRSLAFAVAHDYMLTIVSSGCPVLTLSSASSVVSSPSVP
jgi:hypothetical protein